MSNPQALVREFHFVFGHPVAREPEEISPELVRLRLELIFEELGELIRATFGAEAEERVLATWREVKFAHMPSSWDHLSIADALGDMVYVIYGMAIVMGIPLDKVVAEIHRSNMSKLGPDGQPVVRNDGKILKGPDYSPPGLAEVLYGS